MAREKKSRNCLSSTNEKITSNHVGKSYFFLSTGKLTHMKEDYGNFQQAQQFYSLPGRLQEAYLEREILECRRFMSGPQCIRMLNDYRVGIEYL